MDVEGSTSEMANRGRSEEETAQLRNIPRLFSKYSKIPNKATSKRSTSIRWQLLKYLEITNNGEHFNENIFEFWETMENQLPAFRGARRNFFRGGQAMYLLSTGVNKTLLLQPGFAKGLEPKVEMILFKKCCNWTAC